MRNDYVVFREHWLVARCLLYFSYSFPPNTSSPFLLNLLLLRILSPVHKSTRLRTLFCSTVDTLNDF